MLLPTLEDYERKSEAPQRSSNHVADSSAWQGDWCWFSVFVNCASHARSFTCSNTSDAAKNLTQFCGDLGHNSKAVHRAYAKWAVMKLPSLEQYEQAAVKREPVT
jgi:hypothetical protein